MFNECKFNASIGPVRVGTNYIFKSNVLYNMNRNRQNILKHQTLYCQNLTPQMNVFQKDLLFFFLQIFESF